MIKQVKDLQQGDTLASGAVISEGPFDSVQCPKGKVNIGVTYSNGKRVIAQWGKYTEVRVVEHLN